MMTESKSEKSARGRDGQRRPRKGADEAREVLADAAQNPGAALETFVQELPGLARANPAAAVAVGVGVLLAVGLVLRSKLGRTLLTLAGGYALQQVLARRADFGIAGDVDEQ